MSIDWTQMKTAEQLEAERLEKAEEQARLKRDGLLKKSDWTQVSDAPVDQSAWANYRQALRDLPEQEGFPQEVVWPNPPA
jgi:hypothetical protein